MFFFFFVPPTKKKNQKEKSSSQKTIRAMLTLKASAYAPASADRPAGPRCASRCWRACLNSGFGQTLKHARQAFNRHQL